MAGNSGRECYKNNKHWAISSESHLIKYLKCAIIVMILKIARRDILRTIRISDIEGFEEYKGYILYDDGRVYSEKSNKFLKDTFDSNGYQYVNLHNGKSRKWPKKHRLIGIAFVENPDNKEQINHIDGNKNNNHYSNLEWVTNKENRIHGIENGLLNFIQYNIEQYDLDGNYIQTYHTAEEALESLGIDGSPGNIGRVIRGTRKTAYGYVWKQV